MSELITKSFDELNSYLKKKSLQDRFKGYDPFDGLNSPVITKSILGKSRLIRLAWIQFFKRSPINLRKLAFIKHGYNPQALGLFLSSYSLLYKKFKLPEDLETINYLVDKINETKISGYSGACWGYNFSWQARAFYQPLNTPMIVPTAAVFNGLLDANEILASNEVNDLALSTKEFVLNDLNRTYEDKNFAFSYSPLDKTVVFNASLMASKILARIYYINNDNDLLPTIQASVKFCINNQHNNGSWTYGAKSYHQWIDNFHSGYNIECLVDISKYLGSEQYQENIDRGYNYYISTFFDEMGRSKYYSNKLYPIDINSPAQLLVVLATLNKNKDLAELVMNWTSTYMQDGNGFFYYRKHQSYKNKISYLRWSQAWMHYGMAKYLFETNK